MSNPVDGQITDEAFNAERASIALERAELAKIRASLNGGVPKIVDIDDFSFNNPGHIVDAQDGDTSVPEDTTPAPWLHDKKTLDDGHELEYRKPDSSALIGISMVGMDGFDSSQQMTIFNKFMSTHLSTSSLSYVLGRMVDPDDEFGLGELITELTAD